MAAPTPESVNAKVVQTIEMNKNLEIDTLSEFVKIPSVVGSEAEAQSYMKTQYLKMGLKVESFEADMSEIKGHPAYIEVPYGYKNRPNVIGILEGQSDAPSLKLNGHVDVVSAEPEDKWTVAPWGGEIQNGRIYGRGVLDMKGGLIANLFALKAVLESGICPKGTVLLESVIEEEAGGGGGALACFLKGYKADGMFVPEPTDLKAVISHMGIKYFRVRVTGKTAHAAFSHTGVNAIGKMNKIYDALIKLDQKRAAEHTYPLVEKYSGRSCNLNIGTYQAGDWVSTVSGMAQIGCRIGFVPGEKGEDVVSEVEETIFEIAKSDDWLSVNPPVVEWFGWDTEPWVQDETHGFVQAFIGASGSILGQHPDIIAHPGAMDTRFSPFFGIPSLAFGPKGGNIHGPDEYLEIDSLILLTKCIARFIMDWCGYEHKN